jgi:hypothetical protein
MMTKDIIVAAAVTFAVTFAILAAKSGIIGTSPPAAR